jgi:Swiss Army Knife protein, DSP-PTPase phosphatase domain
VRCGAVRQAEGVTGLVGAIVLPDGTAVRGRRRRDPPPPGPLPEFGLYLEKPGAWQPEWSAEWIDWPDFRTPRDADGAADAIVRAYEQARAGRRVEVACGGGTGRTGTVIACMAVLAGGPVDDVVAWTRRTYRRHAVETPGQWRWIRWFAAHQG